MTLLLVIIYFAFISLGLPDTVLGSAWPAIASDFAAPFALGGLIAMVISAGTVISSLNTARLTHWLGTGKTMVLSVSLTAVALVGFSLSNNVWLLVLLAIPLGLGGGAVDAALNNFVALHYEAKHMNYLHSFWGVGATLGPLIMAAYLAQASGWQSGYLTIALIQMCLVVLLLFTVRLWKTKTETVNQTDEEPKRFITNAEAVRIGGVKTQLLAFFSYCSLESLAGLWIASYLIYSFDVSLQNAAFWTALYFLGITGGRFLCGFLASYLQEQVLVRAGVIIILTGALSLLVADQVIMAKIGFLLIGFGCAPIYPNTMHLTPKRFGKQASQTVIGLTMACAYTGTTLMPPLGGFIADIVGFEILPYFILLFAILLTLTTEKLTRLNKTSQPVEQHG